MFKRGVEPWITFKDEILEYMEKLSFSDRFGWTPKMIDELEDYDKMAYHAMLKGQGDAKKKDG